MKESIEGATIRLNEPWLRPGTSVLIGPPDARFRATVFKSHLSEFCDGTHFVEYDVEWWDDRVRYQGAFHSSDVVTTEALDE